MQEPQEYMIIWMETILRMHLMVTSLCFTGTDIPHMYCIISHYTIKK